MTVVAIWTLKTFDKENEGIGHEVVEDLDAIGGALPVDLDLLNVEEFHRLEEEAILMFHPGVVLERIDI